MLAKNWRSAANRYNEAEVSEQTRLAEARKRQTQQDREIKAATQQLQEWVKGDDYQAALSMLRSGGQYDFKSVHLGTEKGKSSSSWSVSTGVGSTTKSGPSEDTVYYLDREGFRKSTTHYTPTYHGEFVPDDLVVSSASPEKVIRVAVSSLRKKPSEVMTYILGELDKIAQKAPVSVQD